MDEPLTKYLLSLSDRRRARLIGPTKPKTTDQYILTTDLATTIALRESLRREQK